MDNIEPVVSDEMKGRLIQLRKDCYGYEDYIPPSKKDIVQMGKALQIVVDGFQDHSMLPHIYELLEEQGDYVPIEIFDDIPHMLETLVRSIKYAKPLEKRGRKKLDLWKRMVTKDLIDLYERETGEKARVYYKHDLAEEPGNNFTIWFHKITSSLFSEMTDSN